jgi:methylisocitrate lyase
MHDQERRHSQNVVGHSGTHKACGMHSEFEAMGYRMMIWPVSSLKMANKAQASLFAALKRDGSTHKVTDAMQTGAERYVTIDHVGDDALDAGIVSTVVA